MKLDRKPFRWGGVRRDFERTSREWQSNSKEKNSYKTCCCCNQDTPLNEPLYCATFKNDNGLFQFKILCRKCAYNYGVGVIEPNGKTYSKYEEYLKSKDTPKKPRYEADGYADGNPVYDRAYCPSCGCEFEEDENTGWEENYCHQCGQRLDWSKEEVEND